MERVVRGRSFTLSKTFQSDGVAQTPTGTPTVVITRVSDATTVTTSAVGGTGTGPYTVTVTASNNLLLDTLDVVWTATIGGQPNTYEDRVEVAGDSLCSLAELGTVISGRTAAELAGIRTQLEQRLEKALGYACVPRYALESRTVRNGRISTRLPLRAVRSLSVASTAYSVGQIATLQFTTAGVYGVWTSWPVVIGYEHGRDFPDEDITRAMLLLAGELYGSDAADGNVVRREADNMAVTYASPSARGAFVGSELNSIVRANALPAIF